MRGRLFNLFKLFCVVASGSLSFSFVNLLLLLLSPLLLLLLLPFSFELEAFTRLLFNGDGLTLGDDDDKTLARLAGRLMLRRDVGLGTMDDFSVVFSALFSGSSALLADSLTADDVADDSTTDAGEGRPRFLRLNWGREGLIKRDAVVLSASLVSLGLSVLPRRLNRFLAGLLRNLFDDET